MKTRKSEWSRRRLLQTAGIGSILGGAGIPAAAKSVGHKTTAPSIYDELGVRTLINGQGVVTFYSCTLMPPEVHRAMERAINPGLTIGSPLAKSSRRPSFASGCGRAEGV